MAGCLAQAILAAPPAVGTDAALAGRSWGLHALYCGVPLSPNVSSSSPSPGWVAGLCSMSRGRGLSRRTGDTERMSKL